MIQKTMYDDLGCVRHSGNGVSCDKCGKPIYYGDRVIYSWNCLEAYHPECRIKKEKKAN